MNLIILMITSCCKSKINQCYNPAQKTYHNGYNRNHAPGMQRHKFRFCFCKSIFIWECGIYCHQKDCIISYAGHGSINVFVIIIFHSLYIAAEFQIFIITVEIAFLFFSVIQKVMCFVSEYIRGNIFFRIL